MSKWKELIRYGFWGAVTTGINLVLFFILKALGVYYLLANALAYTIAVIVNYTTNKKFVFTTSQVHNAQQARMRFCKFVFMRILSLGIDSVLFYFIVSILGANVNMTRLLLSIALILLTYLVNRLWIFKRKDI